MNNLSQAIGEPIDIKLNAWEVGAAGILWRAGRRRLLPGAAPMKTWHAVAFLSARNG
jgi:hypothetical protein